MECGVATVLAVVEFNFSHGSRRTANTPKPMTVNERKQRHRRMIALRASKLVGA